LLAGVADRSAKVLGTAIRASNEKARVCGLWGDRWKTLTGI